MIKVNQNRKWKSIMLIRYFSASLLIFVLSACGGGGDSTAPSTSIPVAQPTVFTGTFVDSAVENINYKTSSSTGVTLNDGNFNYQSGEKITFSIGDINFPEVTANTYITPLDFFQTQDINQVSVVNTLRLLQSLDLDGDATNGINIPAAAHELAKNLVVDFSSNNFDEQVANLVLMSGAVNTVLISSEQAVYHFQQTLDDLNNQNVANCGMTHNKVGQSGYFETFFHNVAGKATIIDDCTIKITQFDYDGEGPEVYFYAAKDHDYNSVNAFPISQKINGSEYSNASFLLRLPDNKSLDDLTGISVWCVDFNADFGHMEFTP